MPLEVITLSAISTGCRDLRSLKMGFYTGIAAGPSPLENAPMAKDAGGRADSRHILASGIISVHLSHQPFMGLQILRPRHSSRQHRHIVFLKIRRREALVHPDAYSVGARHHKLLRHRHHIHSQPAPAADIHHRQSLYFLVPFRKKHAYLLHSKLLPFPLSLCLRQASLPGAVRTSPAAL